MAKLYFRYGTVASAKTLNLLAVAHNYRQQGRKILLLKPKLDTRFGQNIIRTRAGLETAADILIETNSSLPEESLAGIDCILVDEAQFIPASVIEQLHDIATFHNIPVICYGLRTDYRRRFFEGSARLLELADSIEEIKTTCSFCDRKAIFNLKLTHGKPTIEGPQIQLGAEETYLPTCKLCYQEKLRTAKP